MGVFKKDRQSSLQQFNTPRKTKHGVANRLARRSREVLEILRIKLASFALRRSSKGEDCDMPVMVSRRKSEVLVLPEPDYSVSGRNQKRFSVDIPHDGSWWCKMDMPMPVLEETKPGLEFGFGPEDIMFNGLIGKGAHGTVHKASLQDCTVAVKIVSQNERQGASHGELFVLPEVELLQGIYHPNLVEIYGVREVDDDCVLDFNGSGERSSFDSDLFDSHVGAESIQQASGGLYSQTWIVMEYCDRGSLWDAIQKGDFSIGEMCGAPHYSKIMQVGLEIAFGMRHLHKLGIIHGDLKAQNIILQSSPSSQKKFVAKVGDFGLCRRPQHDRMDLTTFSWGTVDHMAPETLQDGKLHRATDVFSFGILLLEMMTGRQPFQGMTTPAVIIAIVQGLRPKIPRTCPTGLATLLQDCWHQDWRKRPAFHMVVSRFVSIM